MGQVQSGNRSNNLLEKGQPKPPGDFYKFPELPYELRFHIWELSRVPRVVEVVKTRCNRSARWVSRCPVPAILSINQETRKIALMQYKFHESERVKIFLDPAIDTLFFNSDLPLYLAKFLLDAREDDLKVLWLLAIHEYLLSIWNDSFSHDSSELFQPLSFLMMDLEILMIGTQIASYQTPASRSDWNRWEGWLFCGGLPTGAESLTVSGKMRDLIFSAQTFHGHLIFFSEDHVDYVDRPPGHISDWIYRAMGGFRMIFGYHWLFIPKWVHILGVKTADFSDEVIGYGEWYKRVYKAFSEIDFKVKRMLAFYYQTHPEMTQTLGRLRIGCFVKPSSMKIDFSTWEGYLRPLCDTE